MNITFNNRIKQVLLLAALILLIWLTVKELFFCMPGLLGAVTIYILSRANYFQLVYKKKWKKGRAAGLFIIYYLFLLGLPIFLAITLISPKVNEVLSDPTATIESIKLAVFQVQEKTGIILASEKSLSSSLDKIIAFIPSLLNSTANLITNLAIMLFFLYYMLYYGHEMEKTLFRIIPLKDTNTTMLAAETKKLVKANALSIPLISIIQGLTATLGYFIFGVQEWALWGFLTGIFAFFPVIGTMIVWIPLVVYTYTTGNTGMALGLMLYSVIVTGNVDYISRITIMKKLGDVHPVITVLGVIVGLGLFGFIGLIFGPLLVNYIIVVFKIYMNEFVEPLAEQYAAEKESDLNENRVMNKHNPA
ncbi:MAG: AI-2E family transporter [Chitinophagaceae bacterium]|nr:AI-2E family transporter [Chitinophagaceae bacterium]MBL0131038.1 AI-2E family transporter [Chitinophagaceae bacterium]